MSVRYCARPRDMLVMFPVPLRYKCFPTPHDPTHHAFSQQKCRGPPLHSNIRSINDVLHRQPYRNPTYFMNFSHFVAGWMYLLYRQTKIRNISSNRVNNGMSSLSISPCIPMPFEFNRCPSRSHVLSSLARSWSFTIWLFIFLNSMGRLVFSPAYLPGT